VDRILKAALFQRVLGSQLDTVASSVRRLHLHESGGTYSGEVEVTQGRGIFAALCARAMRLPPAGRGPIAVDIAVVDGTERWTRHIGGQAMRSLLWARDGLLCERIGQVTLRFELRAEASAIVWQAVGARWLGLPLPPGAFARVFARECEDAGRYHFDVSATLPLIGLLVSYRGWLDVG
jgi:hypothetical protein